jgi:hypothetical protein
MSRPEVDPRPEADEGGLFPDAGALRDAAQAAERFMPDAVKVTDNLREMMPHLENALASGATMVQSGVSLAQEVAKIVTIWKGVP